ncbi:MAG TPA: cysteine--tRNA ligase [Geodermatophilus sp.]|nr:cysteine--tRNA ligase [Geodermatophilus sp.]
MTPHRVPWPGVVGTDGRVADPEAAEVRTAGLRLAGAPLPVLGTARVYTCGITPYDVTHLGHAATFVWADALAAVIGMAGADVVTSRNVTDVDDALTRAADLRGRHYDEFALSQEFLFDRDMTALRVHRPLYQPRARHHVAQVQQLAAALLATGAAYVRDGHVYFRGGALFERCGLDRSRALELAAEFGDDPADPLRDDPFDVPVWRPSGERDPAWPSPWGWGRPGWHAECAAMATSTLGVSVDVLVGGEDLTFPHHAYQAAMVEAASSVAPFARRAMHVGAVRKDGVRMAKSTGNLCLVADLLEDHPPATIRLLLLDRRWDRAWDFEPAQLDGAAVRLERLYSAAARSGDAAVARDAVVAALLDDLDVPRALAVAEEDGGAAARLLIRVLALG